MTEETVSLLYHQPLTKNHLYPFLEALLFGDFDKFNKLDKKLLETVGISAADLERRVKIEAIPRALSRSNTNVQIVSYQQISEILHILKEDVESYIIEAIHEGIVKAKIDESSETIIIKYLYTNQVRLNSEP